ncbi:MAG: inosine/xanthosine triphosphatase [Candidatus Hodarchaeales archaeon]|jgi:inosine/xanthosine triphosphatase
MAVKVLVTSKNPVKIRATREAFSYFYSDFVLSSFEVNNLDPERTQLNSQPIGDDQTFKSSRWRVERARKYKPEFDYYVGIEGGITVTRFSQDRIVVYSSVGNHTYIETVRGCEIPIPHSWYSKLVQNPEIELGDLVAEISGVPNIKQKQGAIGFLTNNFLQRFDILKHSIIVALIPYLSPTLFKLPKKSNNSL